MGDKQMDEKMLNQIVKVKPFLIEKKAHREGAMFIGESAEGRKSYSYNILYENTFDPADNTHRFTLQPDNPVFIQIDKRLKDTGEELTDIDLNEVLPDSLKDMYGAWVIVDMSKTPLCRVYTENVSRIGANGTPELVHKAGTPIHKKDPKTGKDLEELAIITQIPVWGFCRKNATGSWMWLKGNDPMVRIQREINQGRMIYVDLEKNYAISGDDAGSAPHAEEAKKEESKAEDAPLGEAPKIGDVTLS